MRAHRPFYRLCWDAIPVKDGFIVHLYDDFLGYHYVYRVYSTKASDLVSTIKRTINNIKRRWEFVVVVIRLDS